MERKEYQLHDVIFKEQEYQKWMYSICEGAVDICSGYGTPQEKKLITLTEGQFFGEIGLIAMIPRTAHPGPPRRTAGTYRRPGKYR